MDHIERAALDRSEEEHILELRQEELVPVREMREVGQIQVRTEVEEVPRRLELDACAEEADIERVAVNQVVSERREPWEEDEVLVVPVYEEQLVVTKRLVMREQLRIRRVGTTRRELFEDTVRREKVVVEDPSNTGLVHERYPTHDDDEDADTSREQPGMLENFARKVFQ